MDDLLFLSGNDIPFPEAKVVIHQPSLKEIAFIGEETFFYPEKAVSRADFLIGF